MNDRTCDTGSSMGSSNVDVEVAAGFGDEWTRFDQAALPETTRKAMFKSYFSQFPWDTLPSGAVGADFGCGSGRWAALVAGRVGKLFCVDASGAALQVARRNLKGFENCEFVEASVGSTPLPEESLDFGYSLGVLHHIPDTPAGLASCVGKLKRGAPFLLYLYYRFDNRPMWYRALWASTNIARALISRLPYTLRYWSSQLIAAAIYWPVARFAMLVRNCGFNTRNFPLQYYSDKPFYVLRTDALDRFGTGLEKRFTRAEMETMMLESGLERILFNEQAPFWCALGFRR